MIRPDLTIYRRLSGYTMTPATVFDGVLDLARTVGKVVGDVVEMGCCRGGMLAGISQVLPGRTYHAFDSFQGLPAPDIRDGKQLFDGRSVRKWARPGKFATDESYIRDVMDLVGTRDYKVYAGWFADTLPTAKFPDGIALLRLDADLYGPMYECLDALFDDVNPRGLIIIDDYALLPGCKRAVRDYLKKTRRPEKVRRHDTGGGTDIEAVWYIRRK